jgi:uncharacterized protein (TIGR00730 family)
MIVRRLCVFCGSSPGARSVYADAARALSAVLAQREIELVYGGGNVGLMGILADAMLAGGGKVIGVIPEALRGLEVAHEGLPDLRVVGSMHERKALMADLSDGFIALPGGIGTLDELIEITTWSQLGIHGKPIGLLNVARYFDPLLGMLDHAVIERFMRPEHRRILLVREEPNPLLDAMTALRAVPPEAKWIDRDQR